MKRGLLIVLAAVFLANRPIATAQVTETAGQRLANEMRQTQLLNYAEIAGELRTRGRRGKRKTQALTLRTAVEEGKWQSVFQLNEAENGASTTLTISRSPEERPRYFLTSVDGTANSEPQKAELSQQEAMQSFGESDFWYADLGLEFFYWPGQTILRDARIKMRKGISCYVLESKRPAEDHGGYNRVRSWISRDHGGLIYAEAYTAEGKHLKTFEVSDVQKVNGEWKLKELKIRNEQTRSTTRLEFNHF